MFLLLLKYRFKYTDEQSTLSLVNIDNIFRILTR